MLRKTVEGEGGVAPAGHEELLLFALVEEALGPDVLLELRLAAK